MSLADEGPRPGDSPIRDGRKPLGPGYDWLIELLRQIGRPAAFMVCLQAMLFQIYAPPEMRLDAITFGLFIGFLAALCKLRNDDIRDARAALTA